MAVRGGLEAIHSKTKFDFFSFLLQCLYRTKTPTQVTIAKLMICFGGLDSKRTLYLLFLRKKVMITLVTPTQGDVVVFFVHVISTMSRMFSIPFDMRASVWGCRGTNSLWIKSYLYYFSGKQ